MFRQEQTYLSNLRYELEENSSETMENNVTLNQWKSALYFQSATNPLLTAYCHYSVIKVTPTHLPAHKMLSVALYSMLS